MGRRRESEPCSLPQRCDDENKHAYQSVDPGPSREADIRLTFLPQWYQHPFLPSSSSIPSTPPAGTTNLTSHLPHSLLSPSLCGRSPPLPSGTLLMYPHVSKSSNGSKKGASESGVRRDAAARAMASSAFVWVDWMPTDGWEREVGGVRFRRATRMLERA